MTENEKEALKNFIDSLYHVPLSQEINSWKTRAIHAEETVLKIKNTISIAKGLKISYPMMHDAIAHLVFRWNESENLRNQLTEIDKKLSDVFNNFVSDSPSKRVDNLIFLYRNLDTRNIELNKQLSELKSYLIKLSEEVAQKSL